MIEYNTELLNHVDLQHSFFHLDRSDPIAGFIFDASTLSGHGHPTGGFVGFVEGEQILALRLQLGSHLAQYLRQKLDHELGFTATVGISTNKLLSKLVGNKNKPKGQTTLLPPYRVNDLGESNVQGFIDAHDIGKIPGIGFKTAQKLRAFYLQRPPIFDAGLVYGGTREDVTVKHIRLLPSIGPKVLQKVLAAPGTPKDMPEKVWGLMHGVDDPGVAAARDIPQQISVEDSYIKLNEISAVVKELVILSRSLLSRMRIDLTTSEANGMLDPAKGTGEMDGSASRQVVRWVAHPKVIRVSTRPRPPINPDDGSRQRSFARISKSGPMPSFVSNLEADIEALSRRLVDEALLPLFRKLHPEQSGWDLSLVNLCASGMTMGASNSKESTGRDIARMFQEQENVLKQWQVTEEDDQASSGETSNSAPEFTAVTYRVADERRSRNVAEIAGSEDMMMASQESASWEDFEKFQDLHEEMMRVT